jgi:hypothetical protein
MSSFEKHRPGIKPRFFSQKMAQKLPEKKIPSTAAKAMHRSAKLACRRSHHWRAQLALLRTHGTVSIAWRSRAFSAGSRTYVSMRREYVSL